MKKPVKVLIASILLIVSICVVENSTAFAEETNLWSLQQTVDEFGDVTSDAKAVIIAPIAGAFDNTAAKNETLEGYAFFQMMSDNLRYKMGFQLLEYGKTDAVYSDNDIGLLKVKIDDTIYEFPLEGFPPNGYVYTTVHGFDSDGDWLLNCLNHGQDLRCIIYIGSSKYSFNLKSENLPQLIKSENLPNGTAEKTLKEDAYNKAIQLYNDGDFIKARQLFSELNDYSNSIFYYQDIINNKRDVLQGKWQALAGFARHSSYSYYAFDTDNKTFTLYWDNGATKWTRTCDYVFTGENTFTLKNLSEFEGDFGYVSFVECTISNDGKYINTNLPCCKSGTCHSPSTHNGHARFYRVAY